MAVAIGSAPMVGPPMATAAGGTSACSSLPISGRAAAWVVVSEHSM